MNNVLIVTAVEAEREAILRGLQNTANIDCIAAGVGSAAAAASVAKALSERTVDFVISAGIGGGFHGQVGVGGLAVADTIIAADLGSESEEQFLSVEDTGIGFCKYNVNEELKNRLVRSLRSVRPSFAVGPMITVNTTTGTAETADKLVERFPGVIAEGMEGFGVACAAKLYNIPCIEIRAISNDVGPRDRENWRIKEALDVLTIVSSLIEEELC